MLAVILTASYPLCVREIVCLDEGLLHNSIA